MSMFITKFTITLFFCLALDLSLMAQTTQPQTTDNKVSNHEAVCDGALELIPSTMKFERKRYVSKIPARPVKPKKRK
jgi:hypothetical protein